LARLCFAFLVVNPHPVGKGFVRREVLPRVAPRWPSAILVSFSNGVSLKFGWGEGIGCSFATAGQFEAAELAAIGRYALPQSSVIDVGANVGLMTLAAAVAVGPGGSVLAIEPLPSNLSRLAENIRQNGLGHIHLEAAAAGSKTGMATLHLTRDSAYSSLVTPVGKQRIVGSVGVTMRRVDDIWHDHGQPAVSLIKIDVEGTELDVLQGARALLSTCKPVVLVESTGRRAVAVAELLRQGGYELETPPGFQPWNHLWVPAAHMLPGPDRSPHGAEPYE
jgi:FkbM family methyltransferase